MVHHSIQSNRVEWDKWSVGYICLGQGFTDCNVVLSNSKKKETKEAPIIYNLLKVNTILKAYTTSFMYRYTETDSMLTYVWWIGNQLMQSACYTVWPKVSSTNPGPQ